MSRRVVAEPKGPVECAAPDCAVEFVPKRSTARYHSATCRQRAGRNRKAAAHQAGEEAKTGTDAEHGLVRSVRLALEKAEAIDEVAGQLALQLARRAANPDEPSLTALSKEIRALVAEAIGSTPAGSSPTPEPVEDDDVAKARKARDRKRAAAGQA